VPELRPLRETDVAPVLALNERNVVKLAPMDEPRLHVLRGLAERFDVVDVDGVFAGFVVTFAAGATYDSENFSRFSGRYDDFAYLDRSCCTRTSGDADSAASCTTWWRATPGRTGD